MLLAIVMRAVAIFCGVAGALCAAATAAVLFAWAVDSVRPVSLAPLALAAGLVAGGGVCFLVRREVLHWLASRPSRVEIAERAV